MKKILKRLLILVIVLLVLFVAFLAAWVYLLYPLFVQDDREADETVAGMEQIAEESERIDFNEEEGLLYVNNELVVIAKESAAQDQVEALAGEFDAALDDTMGDIGVYKFIFSDAMTYNKLEKLIKEIKSSDIVEDCYLDLVTQFDEDAADTEDDFAYQEAVYPPDDWNGDTWDMDVPRGENWGMEAIRAPAAWGYLDQMSTVKIGLIDSMPDTSHEDLNFVNASCLFIDESTGKVTTNKYTVSAQDHGTHVAGTMGAAWNNTGVTGVMGGMGQLYYAAVLYDSNGSITSKYATAYSYLLALKTLIDQDVQVINISQNTSRLIGFAASRGNQNAINYLTQQANLTEKGLQRIIAAREAAEKSDFVICVAAGNNNSIYYYKDDNETYGYRETMTFVEKILSFFGWRGEIGNAEALYNNFLNLMSADGVKDRVIVVGAVGIDESKSTASKTYYSYAYFSNIGSRVDVVAPGVKVYSTVPNSGYADTLYDSKGNITGYWSGTSMATPHVSGVAGLIFACNPSLTGPEVKQILLASVTGRYYYTDGYSGLVNAEQAVINALKTRESSVSHVLQTAANDGLDLCFVVDTTASMGDDIDNAKEKMAEILTHLAEKTENYRVALVDYRDFSDRTHDSCDYPSKVQLQFSSDDTEITNAIYALDLGNGGDNPETVYSALMEAVKLDWRSNAKKVIIILGDAPPLEPEPETNYSYEDVLLALFNADINLDYDDSDKRAVDSFAESLINVFSIGTNSSSDADAFFAEISENTGGSFVSVDDASQVGEAIINSIEQIEVAKKVDVNVTFGEDLANESIDVYAGNEFQFTIVTDEQGQFALDSMEADIYKWYCPSLCVGGAIDLEEGERRVTASVSQEYWFTPIQRCWQQHKLLIFLCAAGGIGVCVLVPVLLVKIRKRVLSRRNKRDRIPN